MSDYIYGDWHCKPSNVAEAKEIIERAIASGAVNKDEWGGNSIKRYYGVYDGYVVYGELCGTKYTLAELRQKFPLPGEQVEEPKQWRGPEDGLPPVGTVCIGEHEDVNNGNPCTVEILKHNKNGIGCAVFWIDAPNGEGNLFWCSRFFPLRTEREKFVEAAVKIHSAHQWTAESFAESLYDAIKSGQLELPEVKS